MEHAGDGVSQVIHKNLLGFSVNSDAALNG